MNHYAPRQRKSDGRFDYTVANDRDRDAYPVGYCHAWRDWSDEDQRYYHMSDEELAKHRSFSPRYHTDGHATAEEACVCYKEYLLDHTLHFSDGPKDPDRLERCAVCKAWTAGSARVDGSSYYYLCGEHRTQEVVTGLFKVGESWGS